MNAASARADIADLLHRYCAYADTGEFDALGNLFAADGTLDLTGSPVKGPQAIAALIKERSKVRSLHVPSGAVIDLPEAGQAVARSCVLVFRAASPEAALPLPMAAPVAIATYHDRLVHDGSGWRFAARRAEAFMRA